MENSEYALDFEEIIVPLVERMLDALPLAKDYSICAGARYVESGGTIWLDLESFCGMYFWVIDTEKTMKGE